MSELNVYYRESTDEIGVLEPASGLFLIDVGDFAYFFTLKISEWILIGTL